MLAIKKWTPFFLILSLMCISCTQSNNEAGQFTHQQLEIKDYGLFDLGVVDMNDDDLLDIFTANHSGQQSLMLNNGSEGFKDFYTQWKMDQDHHFPGLAIHPNEPQSKAPGVYINWVGPDVHMRTRQTEKKQPVQGRLEVFTAVKILTKQGFKVKVTEKIISPEVSHSTIEFSCEGDGTFSFQPLNHALPFQFHFDGNLAPENIHLGNFLISPKANDFIFQLRDRHGMAWADFNNDDRMDVFITRGGERGTLGKLPMPFWDELFIGTPTGMENIGKSSGLNKNGCPGRQAMWGDYNGDNLLDIYISCGRQLNSYDNMLFQQTSDGLFEDVATKIGLNNSTVGSFVWLDIDFDNDLDLLWADIDGHFLYRNMTGKFSPTPLESFNRNSFGRKLTVSDYDNDGDLDIFSASLKGNILLVNEKGVLSSVLPLTVGLPDKSATANWVDYDNDGLTDLHAVPQGLYIHGPKNKFTASAQLNITPGMFSPFRPSEARATWFDVDNNGTRDLLMASQWKTKKGSFAKWWAGVMGSEKLFGGLGYYWKVDLFKNQNEANHWLQVQLEGPAGNRPAIGAKVTLFTSDGQQMQQVGISDGSYYSQGHYRLYYGLGPNPGPLSLNVDWPDGKTTQVPDPADNRLLKITWPEN